MPDAGPAEAAAVAGVVGSDWGRVESAFAPTAAGQSLTRGARPVILSNV